MYLNGIAPDKEVTGSSFNNFIKFCLKVTKNIVLLFSIYCIILPIIIYIFKLIFRLKSK